MRALTQAEALGWVRATGLEVEVDGKPRVRFPGESLSWHIPLPYPPYRITYLANSLLPYDADALKPCLVWVTDFGFWSETAERVGDRLITIMRSAYDEGRPLTEAPAHLFDASEAVDAQTFVTLAILIGWDMFVIPGDGEFIAFHSHDEYLEIRSRDKPVHEGFREELKHWNATEKTKR